ncbi:MAG: preprotein translocase subunit YajC [Planctomycetes bacterium]|nr:preprotein translocase subunit YajC [Planctomycetota bacterium]
MSQTFLLPLEFALVSQDPKTNTDAPAPTPGTPQASGPAPAGTTGGTQQPAASPQSPCGGPETLIYMGVFLALMYFMVMRPEQKRRKEQQSMLSAIKKGDKVVTLGGMHGVVAALTDKTVTLRIDTVQMTFDRTAIARIERDDAAASPKG